MSVIVWCKPRSGSSAYLDYLISSGKCEKNFHEALNMTDAFNPRLFKMPFVKPQKNSEGKLEYFSNTGVTLRLHKQYWNYLREKNIEEAIKFLPLNENLVFTRIIENETNQNLIELKELKVWDPSNHLLDIDSAKKFLDNFPEDYIRLLRKCSTFCVKSFSPLPIKYIKELEGTNIEHHYLYRKNKIDHFLSNEFAAKTGIYHMTTDNESLIKSVSRLNSQHHKDKIGIIDFSNNIIQQKLIGWLQDYQILENFTRKINAKHIVYEDFFKNNYNKGRYKKIWPYEEKLKYVKNIHIAENIIKFPFLYKWFSRQNELKNYETK